jgi:hypothetical protein
MREIEFAELRGDPTVEDGTVTLAGRCYHGPIKLGDTFTTARTAGDAREVALRVESLLFYGKQVPEIDSGESATMTLTGQGSEAVTARVVLHGDMP